MPYLIPEQPTLTIRETSYLTLMPGTENDVVGWAWKRSWDAELYDGTADLVFDGWKVEHQMFDEDVGIRITMFLGIIKKS